MSTEHPRYGLRGRHNECAVLDRLLGTVRSGHSQVLVVRGQPGVGKSALLEYLRSSASDFRVANAAGVEYEMELPYAGLHQLCAPMLHLRGRLPEPQRHAIETAFGLSAEAPPDRFAVGLAVLGLLSEAAEKQPMVCVVDDAQWLDEASALTLGFVARRLQAESVGLVFALRLHSEVHELAGLTYRELAARTPYSHAHMVRAAGGDELASWLVVRAYLVACGVTHAPVSGCGSSSGSRPTTWSGPKRTRPATTMPPCRSGTSPPLRGSVNTCAPSRP
ncbi:AAA family ATPase [Kribbella sp. NPDC002412]